MEAARETRRLERQRQARRRHALDSTARRTARLERAAVRLRPTAGPLRRGLGALLGSRGWDLLARMVKASLGEGREGQAEDEIERRRRALDRVARRLGAYETGTGQLRDAFRRALGGASAEGGRDAAVTSSSAPSRQGGSAAARTAVALRIAAPNPEAAMRGGDYHLAAALADALERRGRPAAVETAADGAGRGEVRIVLRGRHAVPPRPGGTDLLWIVSHPEQVADEELAGYDRVLVASELDARALAARTAVPIDVLLQFADCRFAAAAGARRERHDLLFVGNWRGVYRRAVWDAHCIGRRPTLVGEGWRYLAPAETIADHVSYAELPDLYRSARILLVDHWDDMRERGYVSNRVFDALASGAFVIADNVAGLSDLLPGGLETYASPADLEHLLARYLASPAERDRVAARGRELVLAAHTVEHRVERLLEAIDRSRVAG